MAEQRIDNPQTKVRFLSSQPFLFGECRKDYIIANDVVAGSIPAERSDPFVAQLVEHAVFSTLVADLFRSECRWNYMAHNPRVAGSNPAESTLLFP